MTYQTEFSDFPTDTMPAIPEGFVDVSWHNDACPHFVCDALGLGIWIDYLDPALREFGGRLSARFIVEYLDGGTETDNWDEVLAFIKTHKESSQ